MDKTFRLFDLRVMHPRLLWGDIVSAAAAVLGESTSAETVACRWEYRDMPGVGSGAIDVSLSLTGVVAESIQRMRRTYEHSRLVELAAIAMGGLALHHLGSHEIVDVAIRGSGTDYLVDAGDCRLEIAGRMRRRDFELAWQQKWSRIARHRPGQFYVCVAEFESPFARIGYTAE